MKTMKPTFRKRPLASIINKEALAYALYVIEDRSIPHMIDGLKPVQRFFLYSTIQNAKTKFNKVAAISGRVSEYGYAHAETAAADAGQLMANDWNNHIPIIEGQGNFGSRMVQEMAAARYTFCKIHENFHKVFKDLDISPEHADKDHIPPAYYLPTIPFVLLNGTKGVAVGFATDIIPHDHIDVIKCVEEYINTGEIKNEPKFKLPEFQGKLIIGECGKQVNIEGSYELIGKTKLIINEIPYKYDREKYIKVLDDLEDKDIIVRYNDKCGKDNFCFEVTLKVAFNTDHENIIKQFKLRQSATQNLTVIDWDSKLREYDKASQLIKDFVDHRMLFTQKRIDKEIVDNQNRYSLSLAKIEFIQKVMDDVIVMKGKTRMQAIKDIKSHENLTTCADILISMNIYHMTKDEIVKLGKQANEIKKELAYWKKTTVKVEYLKDLEGL